MACCYLCVPATSVSAEQVLSDAFSNLADFCFSLDFLGSCHLYIERVKNAKGTILRNEKLIHEQNIKLQNAVIMKC